MAAPVPAFASRDPLSPGFWDERFDKAFTPWERGGVAQGLRNFVARTPGPLSALIPGCGSGHELACMMEAGWDATAIDFSPAAVQIARAGVGQWAGRVVEADFFAYAPPRQLDLIYEQAFLCAMPPAMWPRIAARWAELLPSGGLLAGFFFFGEAPKGPPFGVERVALDALLLPEFDCIEDSEVADSIPVFAGKERWMVWRRR